jgi:hypothetical protein
MSDNNKLEVALARLEERVEALQDDMKEIKSDMCELRATANRWKGAFWVMMGYKMGGKPKAMKYGGKPKGMKKGGKTKGMMAGGRGMMKSKMMKKGGQRPMTLAQVRSAANKMGYKLTKKA